MKPIIALQQLHYHWQPEAPILSIEQFQVAVGERLFLRGPSGCGKTTLLNLIAGIYPPVAGQVSVNNVQLSELSSSARDRFRADHIGLIFQQFNLLPYLSVLDNVLLPCRFSQVRMARARQHYGSAEAAAIKLLEELGLGGLLSQPVTDLSIGQQQRVAAARALIGMPEIIIADEPTSSLDSDNRAGFIDLLIRECDQHGITLLFVSHDRELTGHFSRIVDLQQLNQVAGATL